MEEKEEKVEVTLDSNDPTENFDSEKVDIENITAEEEREQEKAKEDYDEEYFIDRTWTFWKTYSDTVKSAWA